MCLMLFMVSVFPCYVQGVTIWFHIGFKIDKILKANRCQYEIDSSVSFGTDICFILYRFLIYLGTILDPKRPRFWSFGVSAANLEQILECQSQLDLGSKRYLSSKPEFSKRWAPHRETPRTANYFECNCIWFNYIIYKAFRYTSR